MVGLLLLLLDEPVLDDGGGLGAGGTGLLALDLDGHALVLLEAAGEVGLLGGLGGLGQAEGGDVALGVGLLDGGGLVGLELLEVELLDEVGCGGGERDDVSGLNCTWSTPGLKTWQLLGDDKCE